MLCCYVNKHQSGRHKYVKLITLAYNLVKQVSTGFSPFYLLHGFEPNQSIDLAILPNITDQDTLTTQKRQKTKLTQKTKLMQKKAKQTVTRILRALRSFKKNLSSIINWRCTNIIWISTKLT